MTLPDFLDPAKLFQIGGLALLIIQYIKKDLSKRVIPYLTMAMGIGVSFLIEYKAGGLIDWVMIVGNGVIGAILADGGYSFLSDSKSSRFTLPSKDQLLKVI